MTTLQRLGDGHEVLVMVTGYNDPGSSFSQSVDFIMSEARSKGIRQVVWLTMRTADVTYVSPTFRSNAYTFRDNNRILLLKAQQYGGALQVADWATYSAARTEWFTADGVHTRNSAGSIEQMRFISNSLRTVFTGATITPQPAGTPNGWVTVRRGDRGFAVAMVQRALMTRGIALVGGADGVFGQYTQAAVARFQTSVGLPATGVVDAVTAQRLGISNDNPAAPPPPPPATWTNVGIGATGATVAAIQRAVMNSGIYLRGGADGVFGQYTQAAVRTYQSQRGLPATGVVDAATARAMGLYTGAGVTGAGGGASPGATTWNPVARGSRGATVVSIQQALIGAGMALRGGADGVFGSYTQAAVASYQRQRGLPATGVVDAATAQAMGLWSPPGAASQAAAVPAPAAETTAAPPVTTAPPTTVTGPPTTVTATPSVTTTTTEVPTTTTTTSEVPTTDAPTTDASTTTTTEPEPEETSTTAAPTTVAAEAPGEDDQVDEDTDEAPTTVAPPTTACATTTTSTTSSTSTTTTTTTIPDSTTTTTTIPDCE